MNKSIITEIQELNALNKLFKLHRGEKLYSIFISTTEKDFKNMCADPEKLGISLSTAKNEVYLYEMYNDLQLKEEQLASNSKGGISFTKLYEIAKRFKKGALKKDDVLNFLDISKTLSTTDFLKEIKKFCGEKVRERESFATQLKFKFENKNSMDLAIRHLKNALNYIQDGLLPNIDKSSKEYEIKELTQIINEMQTQFNEII